MVHLALEVDPDVEIVHSTHGARWGAPPGKPWLPDHWPDVLEQALRSMGARHVSTTPAHLLALDHGFDLALVGLRRDESVRRRTRMDTVDRLRDDVAECWPLESWSTAQVWACTDAHQIPYASVYHGRRHERMHWPVDPVDREMWSRLRYLGGPARDLPDWVGVDAEMGDHCRSCGVPIRDPAVSPHQPGCQHAPGYTPPKRRRRAAAR